MNSTSNSRIHVLGLGLSYDELCDLAIDKGFSKRDVRNNEPDVLLNEWFISRGYATVCHELSPHEASRYAEEEYDYCIITNFRVVQHDPNTIYYSRGDRARADEWTESVAEALLPGADYKNVLMRMTFDNWGAVPSLIHTFYKHQARGKPIIQSHGLSPDQTDYRPILKERAARLRRERAAGFIVAFHGKEGLKLATDKAKPTVSVTTATTTFNADLKEWDDNKTPTATTFSRHSGVDYFSCKPVLPSYQDEEEGMKTPTASTASTVPSAPLVGCKSDSDEGYFSDKIIYTRY